MCAAFRKNDVPLCSARLGSRNRWPHVPLGDSPADEAWRLFFQLLETFKETFPALTAEFDLSPVQARVLFELDPEQPLPMSALAHTLSCDASNVTGLVDRLEARGLIERRSAEHDRRVKILALTRSGVHLREKVLRRCAEPTPAIAGLAPGEQRELTRLLRRALEIAQAPESAAGERAAGERRKGAAG